MERRSRATHFVFIKKIQDRLFTKTAFHQDLCSHAVSLNLLNSILTQPFPKQRGEKQNAHIWRSQPTGTYPEVCRRPDCLTSPSHLMEPNSSGGRLVPLKITALIPAGENVIEYLQHTFSEFPQTAPDLLLTPDE